MSDFSTKWSLERALKDVSVSVEFSPEGVNGYCRRAHHIALAVSRALPSMVFPSTWGGVVEFLQTSLETEVDSESVNAVNAKIMSRLLSEFFNLNVHMYTESFKCYRSTSWHFRTKEPENLLYLKNTLWNIPSTRFEGRNSLTDGLGWAITIQEKPCSVLRFKTSYERTVSYVFSYLSALACVVLSNPFEAGTKEIGADYLLNSEVIEVFCRLKLDVIDKDLSDGYFFSTVDDKSEYLRKFFESAQQNYLSEMRKGVRR